MHPVALLSLKNSLECIGLFDFDIPFSRNHEQSTCAVLPHSRRIDYPRLTTRVALRVPSQSKVLPYLHTSASEPERSSLQQLLTALPFAHHSQPRPRAAPTEALALSNQGIWVSRWAQGRVPAASHADAYTPICTCPGVLMAERVLFYKRRTYIAQQNARAFVRCSCGLLFGW